MSLDSSQSLEFQQPAPEPWLLDRAAVLLVQRALSATTCSVMLAQPQLAERLQAQEFQASFMREYEGCAAWVQQCCDRARQCGFVETLHGLEIVQATFKIA